MVSFGARRSCGGGGPGGGNGGPGRDCGSGGGPAAKPAANYSWAGAGSRDGASGDSYGAGGIRGLPDTFQSLFAVPAAFLQNFMFLIVFQKILIVT